jgi:hypothetical protein
VQAFARTHLAAGAAMHETRALLALIALAAGTGAALALPYPWGALALAPGLILALATIGD